MEVRVFSETLPATCETMCCQSRRWQSNVDSCLDLISGQCIGDEPYLYYSSLTSEKAIL